MQFFDLFADRLCELPNLNGRDLHSITVHAEIIFLDVIWICLRLDHVAVPAHLLPNTQWKSIASFDMLFELYLVLLDRVDQDFLRNLVLVSTTSNFQVATLNMEFLPLFSRQVLEPRNGPAPESPPKTAMCSMAVAALDLDIIYT